MRRFILSLLLAAMLGVQTGCFIPIFDGDPSRRTRQLVFVAENLRLILDEWERIWFLDMPDHGTPFRTHGGVI